MWCGFGKMKKKILCILLVNLFLFSVCHAKYVSSDSAAIVAEKFLAAKGFPQKKWVLHHIIPSGPALAPSLTAAAPAYYFFTTTDKAGFVIVSGDDIARPILGYSVDGTIEEGCSLPPNMQAWLDDMEQQILQARAMGVKQSDETAQQWKAPSVGRASLKLQTAQWGQGYPFNLQCPVEQNQRCITGCVATAYAILMKYYEYPSEGRGTTEEYTVEKNGIKVAQRNLAHPYRWNIMRMEYKDGQFTQPQVDAVAELMADIGAAIKARYSSDETSAPMGHNALFAHFGFNPGGHLAKVNYTSSEWNEMLRKQLDMSRPVLYSGSPSLDEGGHAFIIDGYTNQNFFYVNWGWGGDLNGLYAMDALNPGNYSFTSVQHAYFDCVPANMLPCVAKVNDSVECPSLNAAFSLASLNGTPTYITMVKDTQIGNDLIGENDDVILDINGCTLDLYTFPIYNLGHLQIVDKKGNGKFVAKKGNNAIINNQGVLDIEGGDFFNEMDKPDSTDYRRCIWSSEGSTTTIKNGKFYSPKQTLCFNGDATIENGDFRSTGNDAVVSNYNTSGQVTIMGGSFINSGVQPDGTDYRRSVWTTQGSTTVIKNGTFSSPNQTLCLNGDATVENGDFMVTGNSTVVANYNFIGQLTINGGSFTNIGETPQDYDYRRCVWTSEGTSTNISDGVFINQSPTQTLCFNGKAVISGGTIENKGNGASCASNSDVTITNCKIAGPNILLAWNDATLKCSGGIYSQKVADIYLAEGCRCYYNQDIATKLKYPYQVANPDGIDALPQSDMAESYYDINGMVIKDKKPGLIIVRKKDGQTIKRFYRK